MLDKVVSAGRTPPLSPSSPPSTAAAGEPLFASAHAALKFAFNFSHGTLKRPSINVLATKGGGSGKGLAGLDGAAQAGMVLAELAVLPTAQRFVIEAKFLPQSEPCACKSPCCRGERTAAAWDQAVAWLTQFVLEQGLTATISHYRLRRAVVERYFGVRHSFPDIAQACGVHKDTASDLNKRVTERFRTEYGTGMYQLEARYKAVGLVPS